MLFKIDKDAVTLLGYSVRFEILILIGILYLILFSHTVCSCASLDLTNELKLIENYSSGNINFNDGKTNGNINFNKRGKRNGNIDFGSKTIIPNINFG